MTAAELSVPDVSMVEDIANLEFEGRDLPGVYVHTVFDREHSAHGSLAVVEIDDWFPPHKFKVGTEILVVRSGACVVYFTDREPIRLKRDGSVVINSGTVFAIQALASDTQQTGVSFLAFNSPPFLVSQVEHLSDVTLIGLVPERLGSGEAPVPLH